MLSNDIKEKQINNMKKLEELWLDFKGSVRWTYTIFWLLVFNGTIIPIWSLGKFIAINVLFILMLLSAWVNNRHQRKLNTEKVKTDELNTLELPTFNSWGDILELYDDVRSAKQFTNTMSKDYPNGLKIKNTKYNVK